MERPTIRKNQWLLAIFKCSWFCQNFMLVHCLFEALAIPARTESKIIILVLLRHNWNMKRTCKLWPAREFLDFCNIFEIVLLESLEDKPLKHDIFWILLGLVSNIVLVVLSQGWSLLHINQIRGHIGNLYIATHPTPPFHSLIVWMFSGQDSTTLYNVCSVP